MATSKLPTENKAKKEEIGLKKKKKERKNSQHMGGKHYNPDFFPPSLFFLKLVNQLFLDVIKALKISVDFIVQCV